MRSCRWVLLSYCITFLIMVVVCLCFIKGEAVTACASRVNFTLPASYSTAVTLESTTSSPSTGIPAAVSTPSTFSQASTRTKTSQLLLDYTVACQTLPLSTSTTPASTTTANSTITAAEGQFVSPPMTAKGTKLVMKALGLVVVVGVLDLAVAI